MNQVGHRGGSHAVQRVANLHDLISQILLRLGLFGRGFGGGLFGRGFGFGGLGIQPFVLNQEVLQAGGEGLVLGSELAVALNGYVADVVVEGGRASVGGVEVEVLCDGLDQRLAVGCGGGEVHGEASSVVFSRFAFAVVY